MQTELPEETSRRIRIEADDTTKLVWRVYSVMDSNSINWSSGYIAGATAEATRAQVLVEALEKIKRRMHHHSIDEIVDKAFSKYNKPTQP